MTNTELETLKDRYLATAKEELAEFDKNFFVVTAGLFAFTVTFIQDIVDLKTASFVIFLLISWLFLACAIGLIIFAFYNTSLESLIQAHDVEMLLENSNPPSVIINPSAPNLLPEYHRVTRIQKYGLRLYAVVSFLIGLCSLSIFLIVNFYQDFEAQLGTIKSQNHIISSLPLPLRSPSQEVRKTTTNSTTTAIKPADTVTVSSTLTIKPETLYIKAQGYSPLSPTCTCLSNKVICTPKCKMLHKQLAR